MTKKQYFDKAENYGKSNPAYSGLLFHIAMYCHEDYLSLFKQAEAEGKKMVLSTDREDAMTEDGLLFEHNVFLSDLSIQ